MKLRLSSFFLILLLSACTASSPYRLATGSGMGYKESILSSTQYRVHFKMRGKDRTKAMDFALLRAAELTIEKGFDWFSVVDRQTISEKERYHSGVNVGVGTSTETVRHCGVLGCSTSTRPRYGYGIGVGLSPDSDEVESILEIQMGKGARPNEHKSYDAVEIRDNLRRTHELNK